MDVHSSCTCEGCHDFLEEMRRGRPAGVRVCYECEVVRFERDGSPVSESFHEGVPEGLVEEVVGLALVVSEAFEDGARLPLVAGDPGESRLWAAVSSLRVLGGERRTEKTE